MDEKWVLITGSNRGIGEKVMLKFASEGYQIYAHTRLMTSEFEEKIQNIQRIYRVSIVPLCFDLTDSGAMREVMSEIIHRKGPLDVLVNNAGIMYTGMFQLTEIQKIREVFEVNLFSMMELTQWAIKLMIRKKRGSIVNISSITGIDLGSGQCAYGVSKSAVAAFTKTLSTELRNYGIRVNAVAPGIVDTCMAESESVMREREKLQNQKNVFSRIARPEEVAEAVYFLGSEKAAFVTGQILRVDGGNHLKN